VRFASRLALVLTVLVASPVLGGDVADGWTVSRDGNGAPVMEHSIGPLTFLLHATEDEDYPGSEEFKLTVAKCSDVDWYMSEILYLDSEALSEKTQRIVDEAKSLLTNAHLNCDFPESADGELMSGIEQAYASYEKLK